MQLQLPLDKCCPAAVHHPGATKLHENQPHQPSWRSKTKKKKSKVLVYIFLPRGHVPRATFGVMFAFFIFIFFLFKPLVATAQEPAHRVKNRFVNIELRLVDVNGASCVRLCCQSAVAAGISCTVWRRLIFHVTGSEEASERFPGFDHVWGQIVG